MNTRVKLTITLDGTILSRAKTVADQKHIPLSRLIENFLQFLVNPHVYCFKCGERFDSSNSKICLKCGWIICPKCGACGCGLSEETIAAVYHMRRVYEDLLAGKVKRE
ncbi:TPA: hypothetical protein ENX78_07230 [Candidatus Poribacteria bacterium]|jgi:hypothetical protein|nr:hypothetical protein [Candidatus Poribacteria bacterium]